MVLNRIRYRHLMLNLVSILPHCKKDNKVESKATKGATLNELVELKSCSSCLFFEVSFFLFVLYLLMDTLKNCHKLSNFAIHLLNHGRFKFLRKGSFNPTFIIPDIQYINRNKVIESIYFYHHMKQKFTGVWLTPSFSV